MQRNTKSVGRRHTIARIVAGVTAAATLFSLAACGGSDDTAATDAASTTAAETTDAVISVFEMEPSSTLSPLDYNESYAAKPLGLLFSGLVGFDENGNAVNEVADSITANSDNTVFDITLKDGWTFTDGTPVTSESFTRAWSWGANLANAQMQAAAFSVIQGYDALQDADGDKDAQLSGLEIVDDTHFTVTLFQPTVVFPLMLGELAYSPLPESYYDDPDGFGEHPVGDGAYTFDHWDHNSEIALVRNDNYKGEFPAKNGGITFTIYTSGDAAYADVEAGALDVTDSIGSTARATFQTDTDVQAYNEAGAIVQTFTFPSDMEHFGNDEEGHLRRQAISKAIDRQNLVDKILGGMGTPARDFTSPKVPGWSADLEGSDVFDYDPEGARELWEKANAISPWDDDTDAFTIAYNEDGSKETYDAVCNSIRNALGITVTANTYPTFTAFQKDVIDGKMTCAYRSGWQPDYPSMESYLTASYASVSADGAGDNTGNYKNPEFDALLKKANAESSLDAATQDYIAAQKILMNDLPAIPVYYSNASGAAALGVKGFTMDWRNMPVYRNITK